ncbi:response regulator transcription factor [Salarchaeum japonicum]|uniref:Response regulator n=1 Tax=Salarchaeum japonicum TaxID=555573 RepID=A0AAV3T2C2_9EURY|nr:response regulator [Salarchaeum japonicum]
MPPERPSSDDAEGTPTVLAVDDDTDLADTYAIWLDQEYDVQTAYGGEEALSELDEDVDVVLLDRRMPGMSGGEVLDRIREAGYDCRVAMLTAVEPDADIVEMGFDDYLTKPVTREELVEAVNDLYTRLTLDDTLQELYATTSKIAVLESELPPEEQQTSDALSRLHEHANALESQTQARMDDLDDAEEAFREADF